MKKIYLILSYTGTILSRLIYVATRDEYAHVSLSLDKDLKEMYSFGRLNPYNPFWGGFVHESPDYGTFKRFEKTTKVSIYELEISEYQYKKLKKRLKKMSENKSIYKFNMTGLVAAKFRYKIKRVNAYYCAEFIRDLIDREEIKHNLPEVVKPEDFKYMENTTLCYKGMLRDYKKVNE